MSTIWPRLPVPCVCARHYKSLLMFLGLIGPNLCFFCGCSALEQEGLLKPCIGLGYFSGLTASAILPHTVGGAAIAGRFRQLHYSVS